MKIREPSEGLVVSPHEQLPEHMKGTHTAQKNTCGERRNSCQHQTMAFKVNATPLLHLLPEHADSRIHSLWCFKHTLALHTHMYVLFCVFFIFFVLVLCLSGFIVECGVVRKATLSVPKQKCKWQLTYSFFWKLNVIIYIYIYICVCVCVCVCVCI